MASPTERTELLQNKEPDRFRRTLLVLGAMIVGAVVCVGAYAQGSSYGLPVLGKGEGVKAHKVAHKALESKAGKPQVKKAPYVSKSQRFPDPVDSQVAFLGLEAACREALLVKQKDYVVKCHELLKPHLNTPGCQGGDFDPLVAEDQARQSVDVPNSCNPGRFTAILDATWEREYYDLCHSEAAPEPVSAPVPEPAPEPVPEPVPEPASEPATPADTDSITYAGDAPNAPVETENDLTDAQLVGTHTTTSDGTEEVINPSVSVQGNYPPPPDASAVEDLMVSAANALAADPEESEHTVV